MTKAPISLQELRRRIYRKAKSEHDASLLGALRARHEDRDPRRGLPYREEKRRCPGHRWPELCGHRVRGTDRVSCGGAGRPYHRQVQTHAEPPGGDPEGQRQSPNASDSLYPRPRGARRSEADPRSYLRGGFLLQLLRISTEAVTTPRAGGSQAQCVAAHVYSDRC